jgi:DNA-binding winged helix-turn-helix (wHTH) protein
MEQAEAVIDTGTAGGPASIKAIVHSLVNQSLITPIQDQWGSRFGMLHPIRQWVGGKLDDLSSISETLELETVRVHLTTATAVSAEGSIMLSDKECGLLRYLAERPGVPVTRATLLQEVWGYSESVVSRTADSTMLTLRKKVDTGQFDHLQTVRGVGYQFLPLPGRFSARIEAKTRHLQWHVQRLNELWVAGKLSSSPRLREFQACYRRDIAAAVQYAIEQRDGKSLEELLRYGLYKGVNYPVELAWALSEIGDTNQSSTRKVVIDFFQLARDYDQVIKWSETIGEDWAFSYRFLIRYNRAQAFFMTGRCEKSLELLLQLLQEGFPETAPLWPSIQVQLRIAIIHLQRGSLADMRSILHRLGLPQRIDQFDVYQNVNAIPLSAMIFDTRGETEQARRFLERTERRAKTDNAPRASASALEQLGLVFLSQARAGGWPDAAVLAEKNFREALVLYENLWESWVRCSARLTSVYIHQGRLDDADAQFQRTRECAALLNHVVRLEQVIEMTACELAVARSAVFDLRRSLDRLEFLLEETPFWFHDIVRHLLEIDYCALKEDTRGLHEMVNKTQQLVNDMECHPEFSLAQRLRAARLRYEVP